MEELFDVLFMDFKKTNAKLKVIWNKRMWLKAHLMAQKKETDKYKRNIGKYLDIRQYDEDKIEGKKDNQNFKIHAALQVVCRHFVGDPGWQIVGLNIRLRNVHKKKRRLFRRNQ